LQTIEALKQRIERTEQLGSVVSTMKALSAVHIHQYEAAVESLRRYDRSIELGLQIVLQTRGLETNRRDSRAAEKTAVIVFGSDYGLCGQFNAEIAEYALERLDRLGVAANDRIWAAIGARAAAALRGAGQAPKPEHEFECPSSTVGIEGAVRGLLLTIDDWNARGDIRRVLLVYHQHRASKGSRLRAEQLLPVDLSRFRHLPERPWPSRRLPTFTMDAERLIASLLRQFFSIALFRAFAESSASEHASRLQSMQAAGRNIEDELDELRVEFQRQRQDAITAELLDIVSGYEVLSAPKERVEP
jgi:F-type H+-transporting ATPase subunit gamma